MSRRRERAAADVFFAPREVGDALRHANDAEAAGSAVENVHAARARAVEVPDTVDLHAVRRPGCIAGRFRPHRSAGEGAVRLHVEAPDVPAHRVVHVELRFIQREAQAVRLLEIRHEQLQLRAFGAPAVDAAEIERERTRYADILAYAAERRVAEIDRAVGLNDDIVGTVEPLAVITVGEHREGTVVLGAGDAAVSLLATDQPPRAVHGVTVGIAGGLAEDAHRPGRLVVTHDPIVGDVAEDQVPPGGKVRRAFGPAASREQAPSAWRGDHELSEKELPHVRYLFIRSCG